MCRGIERQEGRQTPCCINKNYWESSRRHPHSESITEERAKWQQRSVKDVSTSMFSYKCTVLFVSVKHTKHKRHWMSHSVPHISSSSRGEDLAQVWRQQGVSCQVAHGCLQSDNGMRMPIQESLFPVCCIQTTFQQNKASSSVSVEPNLVLPSQ